MPRDACRGGADCRCVGYVALGNAAPGAVVDVEIADPPVDAPVAHLVLNKDWPTALCGATVSERFGVSAPGMDRCPDCLKAAAARRLGRPGPPGGPGWSE